MKKIVLGVMVASMALTLVASTSFAAKKKGYAEGSAGAGSISGTVSLKGAAMAPIMENLAKGKNVELCSKHPKAKDGIRPRIKVSAAGGKLKDAVVFIEEIDGGKPWGDGGKFTFDFKDCDITQLMGAVRKPSKAEKKSRRLGESHQSRYRHLAQSARIFCCGCKPQNSVQQTSAE